MAGRGGLLDPVLFYQQIHTLNQALLAALESEPIEPILALLEERAAWMRESNRPSLANEAAQRTTVLGLLDRIRQQDTVIVERLESRQQALGAALKDAHLQKLAQGYAPATESGEARFLDRSG